MIVGLVAPASGFTYTSVPFRAGSIEWFAAGVP
jgi:hypothetical protein